MLERSRKTGTFGATFLPGARAIPRRITEILRGRAGGFANSREWSARRACAELPDRESPTVKVLGWSWSGTAVAQRLRGSTYSTAFWARESWLMRCQSVSRLEARSNCWRVTHASSSCRSIRTCDSCIAIHPPLHEGRSDLARESATMSVGRCGGPLDPARDAEGGVPARPVTAAQRPVWALRCVVRRAGRPVAGSPDVRFRPARRRCAIDRYRLEPFWILCGRRSSSSTLS